MGKRTDFPYRRNPNSKWRNVGNRKTKTMNKKAPRRSRRRAHVTGRGPGDGNRQASSKQLLSGSPGVGPYYPVLPTASPPTGRGSSTGSGKWSQSVYGALRGGPASRKGPVAAHPDLETRVKMDLKGLGTQPTQAQEEALHHHQDMSLS